jgi:hypothetical protein
MGHFGWPSSRDMSACGMVSHAPASSMVFGDGLLFRPPRALDCPSPRPLLGRPLPPDDGPRRSIGAFL